MQHRVHIYHFCFSLHKSPLGWLLYLADTLGFLPYSTLEEPLFVVHHIEMTISVTGSSLLQQFKEVSIGILCLILMLLPRSLVWMLHMLKTVKRWKLCVRYTTRWYNYKCYVMHVGQRITGDRLALNECCSSSQGCMLLLVLKQHLKQLFGLSDKYVHTLYQDSFVNLLFHSITASANNILQLRLVLKLTIRLQHKNKVSCLTQSS